MIARPLAFRRDHHWRELSPEEGQRRWRFETLCEIPYRLDHDLKAHVELCDDKGRVWVVIDGRWWLIQPHYATNGCSPKRHVPLLGWIGTPDVVGGTNGDCGNLIGSLWHDTACQMEKTDFIMEHFTGKEIDHGFHQLLKQTYFKLADQYHSVVAAARPVWPRGGNGAFSRIIDP